MRFSGHETFCCKQFWLKKGYDFIQKGNNFTDEDAVIELGVGKNMVSSISFWMKSFGLLSHENELTEISHRIFNNDQGIDKYLENNTTIWLLHYLLVINNYASAYYLFFTDFHRVRNEFDYNTLEGFYKRKCVENDYPYNQNTIQKDIKTLLKTYIRTSGSGTIDDLYSTLLVELGILLYHKSSDEKNDLYSFNYRNSCLPPFELILYVILSNTNDNTIDFRDLMYGKTPIGLIFCLTESDMDKMLKEITTAYKWIVYNEDAGIKQIQIKERPFDNWIVLDSYYKSTK